MPKTDSWMTKKWKNISRKAQSIWKLEVFWSASKSLKKLRKKLTAQDILNNIQKVQGPADSTTELERVLEDLQNKTTKNKTNTFKVFTELSANKESGEQEEMVTCIYYQSGNMKKLLRNYGSVIQLDGTYKLLKCGYVLVPYVVFDNAGKSCLCSWAIISSETASIHQIALQALVDSIILPKSSRQSNMSLLTKVWRRWRQFVLCCHMCTSSFVDSMLFRQSTVGWTSCIWSRNNKSTGKFWRFTFQKWCTLLMSLDTWKLTKAFVKFLKKLQNWQWLK